MIHKHYPTNKNTKKKKKTVIANPTNCGPFAVASQGIGDQGTVADFASPFQAVNCYALPFGPKFAVRQLGGHKATPRSKNPALRFDLFTRTGDANIRLCRRDPAESRSRSTSDTSATSARRHSWPRNTARAWAADRRGLRRHAAPRAAPEGPGLRRLGLRKAAARRLHPRRPGDDHAGSRILLGERTTENHRPWLSRTPRWGTSASTSSAGRRAISSTPGICAARRRSRRSC